MSNFTTLAVVVTTLFIMTVLVVDHIEVNRHARLTQADRIQEIEAAFEAAQLRFFEDGIGYTNATYEEMAAATQNKETIIKIQTAM